MGKINDNEQSEDSDEDDDEDKDYYDQFDMDISAL